MDQITVVGGGLAGLVAAIECAERGAPVRLLEARARLGGRATSTGGPYVANLGPHAFYAGGAMWDWLKARDLHRPFRRPIPKALRFVWRGELRRTPPRATVRALRHLRAEPPVDTSFRDWMTDLAGAEAAAAMSGIAGVVTFDHDPGRASAAFVWPRIRRILLSQPPVARYVVGGWGAVVDRLAASAAVRGVQVERGAKLTSLDEVAADGPVIVAVEPGAARRLLGSSVAPPHPSPGMALLDVGLRGGRRDPYVVLDIDGAAFVDRFTAVDRTLAPSGHELLQAQIGLRPDEPLDGGIARLEAVLDLAYPEWRGRETWRRRAVVRESTGGLELPGTTWRDRPPIAHAPGIWLAGDWVAAEGHLAEASCASAVAAAAGAVAELARARAAALV